MELQDPIRKKLRKALQNAAKETKTESALADVSGCCEISIGNDIVERRGGITRKRCEKIAEVFGGTAHFQPNVDC